MERTFSLWIDGYEQGCCVIKPPVGIEKAFQLGQGVPRASSWPLGVVCPMDPEFPGDTELSDSLYGGGFRIVSPGMRAFLQRVQPDHIEYLPVRIVDHQGRVASEQYSLVHPVGQVDCIDLEASGVDWSPLDPKLIDSCDQLIIDARRVPPERVIFRPKHLAGVILVRDDVARELSSSGLRGVFLQPASEYIGI